LNIGLRDRWFVTFYPSNDIRINYGQPVSGQTGRLFLPFDAAIGRKMTDDLVISLEAFAPSDSPGKTHGVSGHGQAISRKEYRTPNPGMICHLSLPKES
jgi:hypothetical protein